VKKKQIFFVSAGSIPVGITYEGATGMYNAEVVTVRAARAELSDVRNGVVEVAYAGVMTASTFELLRAEVLLATIGAKALVLRMDKLVHLMDWAHPCLAPAYPPDTPPAAVVCSAGQLGSWRLYSQQAAEYGVMRAVFSRHQLTLARDWAVRHAAVKL
jgi:hypothetical protein